MDEPRIIKRIRIPTSNRSDTVCGLTLYLWENLMFRHFELVDLIMLYRVCSLFAGYRPLKKLIRDKTTAAFRGFPKKCWNKLDKVNKITYEFLEKHEGKYLLTIEERYKQSYLGSYLGAYSTKQRLIKDLIPYVEGKRGEQHGNILIIGGDNRITIRCTGITNNDLIKLISFY